MGSAFAPFASPPLWSYDRGIARVVRVCLASCTHKGWMNDPDYSQDPRVEALLEKALSDQYSGALLAILGLYLGYVTG